MFLREQAGCLIISMDDASDSGVKRPHAGFTLLEVLVALTIMSIAVTLLIQLFSSNLQALSLSGDTITAAARANARLREIVTEPALTEASWRETGEKEYPMDIAVAEVLKERTAD